MKKSEKRQPKTLYFDYAATAQISHAAKKAMDLAYGGNFGNPGSVHRFGMSSMSLLDEARETIAEVVGGEFKGVIFTSSATEANNLFLKGIIKKYARRARMENIGLPAKLVISSSEHESVEQAAEKLSEEGTEVVRVPVNKNGKIDLNALGESITGRTVAVSLIFTNNETGAVNDIKKAAKIISEKRAGETYPLFHVDASQSLQYEDCSFQATGADAITISSHKIGGPKGAGALVFREADKAKLLEPQTQGGGQELGMRSGTENVPAIAGFAAAAGEAAKLRKAEAKRVMELKKSLFKEITKVSPRAKANGPEAGKGSPHILNVWLPGMPAETAVVAMDMEGIAVSYGSACSARAFKPSRAVKALGYPESRAKESVRISLGRETKAEDIRRFGAVFKKIWHNFNNA